MKKRIAIVGLTLASLVLSACDAGTSATSTPTVIPQPTAVTQSQATANTSATLTGKIDVQAFGDPPEIKVIESLVDGFKTKYPGTDVNIISVPSQGEHMTKLSTAFAAGNAPDVWLLNYRRYGQFAAQGVIEPAGPLMAKSTSIKEDMYFEQALNAFRYQGVLQCVPQNISSLVVYYNKDMFTKAGVPFPKAGWTWQDFLGAARQLSRDENGDGVNDVHGLGTEIQIIRLAPFVWGNGGDIVDNPEKPTRLTLREGAAREAVQFFMDLQLVHKVVPTEAQEKAEDSESRFINGRLGMYLASRVATPAFREIKGFEWDVAGLPVGKQPTSILHSDAFCVSKEGINKNKDLAWAFVEYTQGVEGQTRAASLGRTVPSLKEVAASPAFLQPSAPPASSQVFIDAIPVMKQVPVLSTWPKIESTINEELERAFYGLAPIDVALQKAEEDTRELFAEANK